MGTPRSREKESRELCTRAVPRVCPGCCKILPLPFRSPFCRRQVDHRAGGALLAVRVFVET